MMRSLLVVAALTAGACSGSAAPRGGDGTTAAAPATPSEPAAPDAPANPEEDDTDADADPPMATDVIDRATLIGVLDAGPGAFLGTVKVEAFFRAQRFAGWRLLDLDSRYRRAGLQPGDVVTGANGVVVSKPEHLADVFAKLRQAESLVLAGERDGKPFELVFAIEGAAPAPAPARGQK